MNPGLYALILMLAGGWAASTAPAARAQAPAAKTPPAKTASTGKAAASSTATPSAAERARQAARRATAAGGAAAAATATALALADDDQRQAFGLTHLGDHDCEFKRSVRVVAHPTHEGYVNLHFDRKVITAKPVLSSTGAIRLEDVRGEFLLLQIAFKSMLMDVRRGQRLADECVHERHVAAREAAATAPPAPGLGILPGSTPPPTLEARPQTAEPR